MKKNQSKVLVIGDICLDKFIEGSVERISPEAPVPIFRYLKEKKYLGCSANVALSLKKLDISCEVVNCRFIKPMDENYLEFMLEKFSSILTIEEGVRSGGFGEGVLSWLSSNNYKGNSSIISLPDKFVEHGPRDLLLKKWGINKDQIIKTVTSFKSSLKTEF